MSSRLNFFFSEALRSLSTNLATSAAATLMMLVTLFSVGFFLFVFVGARAGARTVERDAGVVKVFLMDTATSQDVNALRVKLDRMPEVQSVKFFNKQDALAEAKQLFKDNPDVVKNLPGNPFPASLRAKLRDATKVNVVADRMRHDQGVSDVKFGGQQAQKVIAASRALQLIFTAISVFLIAVATVLISNTIRLSIFSRRREIEVMKLVGASNMFVRLPFMIEGFLCGLVAAVFAIFILYIGGVTLGTAVGHMLSIPLDLPVVQIFLALLGMGIVLGGLGSGMTIRKYLRV